MDNDLLKVAEGILDGAASEKFDENRTHQGIKDYADGALNICLSDSEAKKIKSVLDWVAQQYADGAYPISTNDYYYNVEKPLSAEEQ